MKIKDKDISSKDAGDVYRKLISVADGVIYGEDHFNLQQKYEKLGFTQKESDEVEKQLLEMVEFFVKSRLVDYCR